MPSQYPSANIDKNTLSVYNEGITVEKKNEKKPKKYNDMLFLQTKLLMDRNSSVKSVCNI